MAFILKRTQLQILIIRTPNSYGDLSPIKGKSGHEG